MTADMDTSFARMGRKKIYDERARTVGRQRQYVFNRV